MFYLLFIIYLSIICFIIPKTGFVKKTGLNSNTILLLFLIKVTAGLIVGWISIKYAGGNSDYLANNILGWEEYQIMLSDPKAFLTEIFHTAYNDYGSFFGSVGSYWNDLETKIIIKILAVFNIISRGNYFINSLFFNSFAFLGHIALYRIFIHIYPKKNIAVLTGTFLLPSLLFFSSGIGKDNIVFTLSAIIFLALYSSFTTKINTLKIVAIIFSFTGILLLRNYVALAMLPAGIAYFICKKFKISIAASFTAVYIITFAAAFLLNILNPAINPAKVISDKQHDFFELPAAKSQIKMDTLLPTTKSLLSNLPQAVNHGLLRPYLWEKQSPFLLLLAIELSIYISLFIFFIVSNRRNKKIDPFIPFAICFSLCILILIGYIVPNTGSLVRYRSIYLPFLITPILCSIPVKWPQSLRINL